jgi:putative transposase
MALSQSALLDLLAALDAADGVERVRLGLQRLYQELIEAEATERIGAGLHERSDARLTQRNGHRSRVLSTTAGGRSSRPCWSGAAGSIRRCSRW